MSGGDKRKQQPESILNTPYDNTIAVEDEPKFEGDPELEQRLLNLVRWNAMAMVVRGNLEHSGIGGHISTFASSAVLYEVGQNHFFNGGTGERLPDLVYFQGHASPGMYSRAFLEGRLTRKQLEHFRQDLAPGGGITSYPHPYIMPEFWQFPTVSMGLGPVTSVYQARLLRYLQARELLDPERSPRVWCFPGDGEMDEPESVAGLSLAAREKLDNLTWVVNCNLQRLDGPVRGNGKVLQELERVFTGAGWNVIKVVWGSRWCEILRRDHEGRLAEVLESMPDGEFQHLSAMSGHELRQALFSDSDYMRGLVEDLKDAELGSLKTGGHDPLKVYAAYHQAVRHRGQPTVILAQTVKGFGLGESGEARNVTHQKKKLNEKGLRYFRDRFDVPIADEDIPSAPFYRPDDDDPVIQHLHQRRKELGGYLPRRTVPEPSLEAPDDKPFAALRKGGGNDLFTTTSASVRLLSGLLKDKEIGARILPVIPDEARTFGADALFREVGIYASQGQRYEPVDRDNLLYYREDKKGQILEEGITEAGAMSSFIAAGTAGSRLGIELIPFYYFYSMFGFQRIGDLAWAAGDSLARGFLMGATAGRTTLNGEGLQHQDGHSQLLAASFPNLLSYDPAFAYEVAVIIREGIRRMFLKRESVMYYLTLYNEPYAMPAMPEGAEKGILEGLYLFREKEGSSGPQVNIFASGSIMPQALAARDLLLDSFGVSARVWSATSYKALRSGAVQAERWNRMHPEEEPRKSYLERTLSETVGPIVAVSDYMRLVPDQIRGWVRQRFTSLGTDGFGRSDTRERLRDFYGISPRHIAWAAMESLWREGELDRDKLLKARDELEIDPDGKYPRFN